MAAMVTSYFADLFSADNSLCADPVIDLINTRVTDHMNDALCVDFSDKEIADALFQIGPLKAPGPDGFPARFFQRNWVVMPDQVITGVKEFFRTGLMPKGVNDTAIVLSPKVDNPEKLTEFRPISLCNVIYKVVSKCLQEKDPDKSFCAYKLDLSKAYDRVDWIFLERMMQKMGFARRWVNWIMPCVTSVRYTVKFNGTLLDSFAPSRGLRQGDPLSSFLFLLVADGLSALLKDGERNGDYTPLKICRRAPGVSHLLFADDTLLFFKAKEEQARKVQEVLNTYEKATGQCINPAKCSALFGNSCAIEDQEKVRDVLHIETVTFEEKYLGLPTPEGCMSKEKFQNLQSRLLKRIIAWGDTLSLAGKEIMIKAIAQAIPTYIMGVFKLPMFVCDDLNRMVRNFWWGSAEGKRKTHWLAWPKILAHKTKGGLGFRDFRVFNQALLARQAWRLLIKPNSLCAQVLKARYYPDGRLEDTVFSGNASSTWQAIQYGLELLKKGIVWWVGDGQNIRIWRDRWVPREPSRQPVSQQGTCRLWRVAELLGPDGTWRMDLLRRYFLPADVDAIASIRTSSHVTDDIIAWAPEKNGIFTVRSAYRFAMDERERPSATAMSRAPDGRRAIWKIIWGCPAPPKQHPSGDVVKGKMILNAPPILTREPAPLKEERGWVAPELGNTKLNTDGSFIPATGLAGGGMVLRDSEGKIIFSACREIRACDNALTAELAACREGLELALFRTDAPIKVELDCAEAVTMITARVQDRSAHRTVIEEIRRLATMEGREVFFSLCCRSQNKVSHELAKYGRSTPRTAVWLHSGLDFIVNLALAEKPP
ncbi:uncharacterized protein [Aegilops tauschii subsp. strangulata]|uniref:uncharacterized protein n=1 Tax=Aegilops tauschii subsp. strangulata TaxID=200361 RepID=UPI003CC89280